jgi:hypothetical protein
MDINRVTCRSSSLSSMGSAAHELAGIEERLQPGRVRQEALVRLGELFESGGVPDPRPEGFLEGRPLALSVSGLLDAVGRRLAQRRMPWLGKAFDREAARGVNVLARWARPWIRVLLPSYVPERELADRIEAFPFQTWVGPSATGSGAIVFKIDYGRGSNPRPVRSVLDELVQLEDGVYLGKVLLRRGPSYRQVGFFRLQCLRSGRARPASVLRSGRARPATGR